MPSASLFDPLPGAAPPMVEIAIDGRPVRVPAHFTVAAALLAAGILDCRTTPVDGRPRGPFCLMGECFECLVEIDGRPNQQGCRVRVGPGMRIRRMAGKAELP